MTMLNSKLGTYYSINLSYSLHHMEQDLIHFQLSYADIIFEFSISWLKIMIVENRKKDAPWLIYLSYWLVAWLFKMVIIMMVLTSIGENCCDINKAVEVKTILM